MNQMVIFSVSCEPSVNGVWSHENESHFDMYIMYIWNVIQFWNEKRSYKNITPFNELMSAKSQNLCHTFKDQNDHSDWYGN